MKVKQTFSLPENDYFPFGFPISERAWNEYKMDVLVKGTAEAADVYVLRRLADEMNKRRDAPTYGVPVVHGGRLLAMGLLTEALRYVIARYDGEFVPGAIEAGVRAAGSALGPAHEQPFVLFPELYPPRELVGAARKPKRKRRPAPPRRVLGREMILLYLDMSNPALDPYIELFDDAELRRQSPYEPLVEALESYFAGQPPVPGSLLSLFDFLRGPMKASPGSLDGQLEYILAHWAHLLPESLLRRLRLAGDILKEETRMRGHGPGPIEVLQFPEYQLELDYAEPERFSQDLDWMSNVVLIAKSVYVWLDQLSKKYGRAIDKLNHIPDEELDRLARWGFTGLWLIGVWERSPASEKIKRIMGNPEALASAYSVYDYVIAKDLGGEEAYRDLRERAWRRGIRLGSDMVPNHMGLYSKWIIEHPQWFIQLDHPPFPAYQFTGPDLSGDGRVSLHIEDGYWAHRDAAVVFRWRDNRTGETRYIYHGNDGTNMPWNDTAQLNFLLPEVRESVIQTILHVARLFPILRFDAAMTLTKKHYQRLWFPQPGDGGAIPSRAEFGMSRAAFDQCFPEEFWREVVLRVQQEAPDTLLLAEAFWLMEGYFVRTLGMHRVYNSAFMNMLKMEDNAKYRLTVRNVLEFSPEVLKRFVNFLNNPDERTAVEQFGKGDKYFGVCTLMATMPGLPMFGHGQIEGFAEKYGMEYRRAYWDEQVDEHLVARHEAEIFPLLRRRHLFSGVEHFAMYDYVTPEGYVDEDVFAYSNRSGAERALVLYNNAYSTTSGAIRLSVSFNRGTAEQRDLRRIPLADALALKSGPEWFYVFRDYKGGMEYIRSGQELSDRGLSAPLQGYQYQVFLDWREIEDRDGTWKRLADSLGGRGAPSIEEAYRELVLEPVHAQFRKVMNADIIEGLARGDAAVRERFRAGFLDFLDAVEAHTRCEMDATAILGDIEEELDFLASFESRVRELELAPEIETYLLDPVPPVREEGLGFWKIPIAYALIHPVPATRAEADFSMDAGVRRDDLLLTRIASEAFAPLSADARTAQHDGQLLRILLAYPSMVDFFPRGAGSFAVRRLLEDFTVQRYLGMNRYQGVLWLVKEPLEQLLYWMLFESVVSLHPEGRLTAEAVTARYENTMEVLDAAERAKYNADEMLRLLAERAAVGG